jgi:Ca-activated chloride channel family protein
MRGSIARAVSCLVAVVVSMASVLSTPVPVAAQQAPSRSVLIVLDLSGSMNDPAGNGLTRLQTAKQALTAAVNGLQPGAVNVGLRTFTDCGATSLVVPVAPVQPSSLNAAINGLSAVGATDISQALLAGANDFPAGGQRTVLLVSDGAHNCGPPTPCDAARTIVARGLSIVVNTVSFQIADPAAVAELAVWPR